MLIGFMVGFGGVTVTYRKDMSYRDFCEKNPHLETRVEWDETTSDAMDAYYYCKEKYEKETARH